MTNPYEDIDNRTRRPTSEALEEIIGRKFNVLDDGWLYVVDYMGVESSIVQAARTSYGEGTKKVSEDINLLRYLMRANHGTPFEMCQIKLHIRVPMDAWRQWIRHRTFAVNEYSTRYSDAINSAQTTLPDEWRQQGKGNKQGSFGFVNEWPEDFELPGYLDLGVAGELRQAGPGSYLSDREERLQSIAREVYDERIEFGVSREQARKDLPLATYTEAYWCGNLRNLLHFVALRSDSHAQQEIREYSDIIGEQILAKWMPNVWEAFNTYHPLRGATSWTATEIAVMKRFNKFGGTIVVTEFLPEEWKKRSKKTLNLKRSRERDEFKDKLELMGFGVDFH